MPLAEGIAATKGALDVSKLALDLLRSPKIDQDQVRTRLIEMQDLILSAQRALGEAEDENRQLRRRLEEAEGRGGMEEDLEFVQDGGFWVRKSERAAGKLISYCTYCWSEKVLLPLTPTSPGIFRCANHNQVFRTMAANKYAEEQEARRRADENFVAIIPGPDSWMAR